jgi:hypothetical protein
MNTEAFIDKVFKAALGTMETFNQYLGDRLGWFDALAEASATPAERTGRRSSGRPASELPISVAVPALDDRAGPRLPSGRCARGRC